MNKLTYLIASCGIFALIVSWVQWFFRFPDPSQLVLGSGVGVCFLGFAYIHWLEKIRDKEIEEIKNWKISRDADIAKLEKRVDDLVEFYTKGEWK